MHLKSYCKKKCKFGTLIVFSFRTTVVFYLLFICAFCHKGKYIFLKSTLNSAFLMYDMTGSFFLPLLGTFPQAHREIKKIFLPVFGIFYIKVNTVHSRSIIIQNIFFIKNRPTLLHIHSAEVLFIL
jgi:hypothetical protein